MYTCVNYANVGWSTVLVLVWMLSSFFHRYLFSDALKALQNEKIKNPFVVNLLSKLSYICATSNVVFTWIPSHMGIIGNERADRAAKSALSHKINYLLKYLILI